MQWQAQGNFREDPRRPEISPAAASSPRIRSSLQRRSARWRPTSKGKYSQQVIDFPTIFVSTNGFELRSTFALKDSLARLDNLHFKQGNNELLSGYAQIPVDLTKLSSPGGPIPDTNQIDVNIASKPLPIGQLMAVAGTTNQAEKPPYSGTVLLEIIAHGSLSKIYAGIKVEARGLASRALAKVRPRRRRFPPHPAR